MSEFNLSRAAGLAGLGLVAGLTGALLMSVSQRAEMAVTRRKPSVTPSQALERIAGADLIETQEQRLSTPLHIAFGTMLGIGLAALADVPEPARGSLFFAGAWGVGTGLVSGLGISDPPTDWPAGQLAIDLGHHAVYAAGATAAFVGLRRLTSL